jgi:hypothetical protein
MDRVGVEQEGVATMFAATEARKQALLPSSVNTDLNKAPSKLSLKVTKLENFDLSFLH